MSEVQEFDPFNETEVAEVAPEPEVIEGEEVDDNQHNDNPEEELAPKPEQPKEKKSWGAREQAKRIEVESTLNTERERSRLIEYQNEQLQKAVDEMLKGKQAPQDNSADIDALLREHGIDPDDVIDKDALAATLKAGQKNTQGLNELRGQITADAIRNSINTATTNNPDFTPAFEHYASRKFNEAKAAVEELGYEMTDDAIRHAVVRETQKILLEAKNRGKDPATILFNLAKASGYKSTGKTKALKEEINYDKLNELRDAAAKPAYNPKIAQSNAIEDDDWVMATIR